MTYRWLAVPDMQVPDHDRRSLNTVLEFIRHIKPDGLLIVGDELDAPSPSKWSRGRKNEYASTLQAEIDECRGVLASFRQALGPDEGKPIHLMRSNHGERIRNYINSVAPALDSLRGLKYEQLLGLDDMRITYHTRPFEFAPNWLLAHGDEGSMIQTPGGTAMGLAKKWGKSVVCGHCFDDKTEILTPQGWIDHTQITGDTVVMTMNTGTGAGEWQTVEGVYRYDHYNELIHVDAAFGLSLAVTEDHGLVVHSAVSGKYLLPKASEAYGKSQSVPLAVLHDQEELPLTDDEIKFIAWVMAEGNVDTEGRIRIAQSDTPKGGMAEIEAVLAACGYDYSKTLRYKGGEVGHGVWHNYDAYRYGMRGDGGWRELIGKYLMPKSKNPNRNLAGMSSHQATVFLLEYAKADGHRATGSAFQLNTKDVEKADFFQELAVRSGRRSSITRRANGGHYTVSINERDRVQVLKSGWSRQPYDGTVWCVSVPNGTLVVRRNGKTAVTQNTHRAGVQHHHTSVNGKITEHLYGIETGHLMAFGDGSNKADYLKAGSANWQQAVTLFDVDGKHVTPHLLLINNHKLHYDGSVFG